MQPTPLRAARSPRFLVALAVTIALAYGLMIPWTSDDMNRFLLPWMEELVTRGPIAGIGGDFYNYTPPYIYLLALVIPLEPLTGGLVAVKLVSIAGTVLLAFAVHDLLQASGVPHQVARAAAIWSMALPTVALNGALWGQCDALYASMLLFALAAGLRDRAVAMMVFAGIALSLKLQAIFLAPLLMYMVILRRVPLPALAIPPVVYAAMMVPAWLAGRSVLDLATIYAGQGAYYRELSMNAPNLWLPLEKVFSYELGVPIGLALAAVGGLTIVVIACWRRITLPRDLLIVATVSAVAMPYLLPKMHDRYFFLADVLSFTLAIASPSKRTVAIAILVSAGSTAAYSSYLFGVWRSTHFGAVLMSIAGLLMLVELLAASSAHQSQDVPAPDTRAPA